MSEFNKPPGLTLLPAVDVAGGKAVRLTQGAADSATSYGDPVDAAADWASQGAEWIHLVDL
ncbi:MAG TPA: HisA/HisF-related TIM barrel protein, partial [Marisediminicola sp.]|nr:HisA/HisF-related TIM barrel protein [Marisediminicola sp.]